ncbi:MAG: GNAT family N-acetyltransferase [Parcubacteria group bacterium]|nr:GNAT family N-acetyltransferase [Parcubacteria group bacterium]
MIIRPAKNSDCEHLAIMHVNYFPSSTISNFGINFVKILYENFVKSNENFLFVAEEGSEILAFISGSIDLSTFQKKFIKKNFFIVLISLLPKIFDWRLVLQAVEVLFYGQKTTQIKLPKAEMTSLVVEEKHQRKGLGTKLFMEAVDWFKRNEINEFRFAVGKNLIDAQKFYEHLGCEKMLILERAKNKKSLIYVYKF